MIDGGRKVQNLDAYNNKSWTAITKADTLSFGLSYLLK